MITVAHRRLLGAPSSLIYGTPFCLPGTLFSVSSLSIQYKCFLRFRLDTRSSPFFFQSARSLFRGDRHRDRLNGGIPDAHNSAREYADKIMHMNVNV